MSFSQGMEYNNHRNNRSSKLYWGNNQPCLHLLFRKYNSKFKSSWSAGDPKIIANLYRQRFLTASLTLLRASGEISYLYFSKVYVRSLFIRNSEHLLFFSFEKKCYHRVVILFELITKRWLMRITAKTNTTTEQDRLYSIVTLEKLLIWYYF